MNIAPAADGLLNASVVAVMHEAGTAINDTFRLNNAGIAHSTSGACKDGVVVVKVTEQAFDYIVTMEDLTHGQRIGNCAPLAFIAPLCGRASSLPTPNAFPTAHTRVRAAQTRSTTSSRARLGGRSW